MRDTLFSGNNVLFARNYVWNARNDKLKRRYFYPINSFNQIILPMTSNFTAFLRPFRAACLFVLLTVCCGGCSDSGSVDETPPADQLALSPSSLVFDEQDPAKNEFTVTVTDGLTWVLQVKPSAAGCKFSASSGRGSVGSAERRPGSPSRWRSPLKRKCLLTRTGIIPPFAKWATPAIR